MSVRNNLWDPFAVDGIDAATVSDGGILFPDHGAFQFDAAAPAVGSADWSDIVVDIDFVDDTLTFSETAQLELSISDTPAAPQDETRTLSTPLDELSALYPGIVWPPMSEWASATNDNDPPPETSSPDDAGIATVQNLGPAGLDWRITPDFDDDPGWVPGVVTQPPSDETSTTSDDGIAQDDTAIETVQATGPAGLDWQVTPDFDDDPGWYPGWIPSPAQDSRTTGDGVAPQSAVPDTSAVTNAADEPPRDETVTASLTLAELNEQYPGIVWPANWWLL
jgi:hypothetical protein